MAIRVLYLAFQSNEQAPLAIEAELAAIDDRLAHAPRGSEVAVTFKDQVNLADLPGLLAKIEPHVVHFACHGEPGGRLVLRVDGEFRAVEMDAVVRVLAGAGPQLRLVVLSACFSAPLAEALAGSGRVSLGSRRRIPSAAAARFSGVLYEMLACGEPVSAAFSKAQAGALGEDATLFSAFKLYPTDGPSAEALLPAAPPAPSRDLAEALVAARVTPHQVLILLDAYPGAVSLDDLEARMDDRRDRRERFQLSTYMARQGMQPLSHLDSQVNWEGLAEATRELIEGVRACLPGDGKPVEYTLGGNAPHAVFAHVGYELGNWARRQTIWHRNREDGRWLRIELGEGQEISGPRFFQARTGLQPTRANGEVALYLGAFGGEVPRTVEDLFERDGRKYAGTVGLVHTETDRDNPTRVTPMTADLAASAAAELQRASTDLANTFPAHSGLVLFVNGPDFLGFLAGRALNPRQIAGGLSLTWYHRKDQAYRVVYTLPLPERRAPAVPADDASRNRLRRLYDQVTAGFEALRETVEIEDLRPGPGFGGDHDVLARRLHRELRALRLGKEPEGTVFELSIQRRTAKIGDGLLWALRDLGGEELQRFGRLLLLHELIHPSQGITGTNFAGVGRAGVVLEELDYQADAFAILSCARWEVRERGPRGAREPGRILRAYLDVHLAALAAFDRMEQGEPLDRLPERRLRRYLIWALQAARAETVHEPAQIEPLLGPRLFVELAPLAGRIDGRGDKLVLPDRRDRNDVDVQLFVGLGGQLIRQPRLPQNFEPRTLVEHVRKLEIAALCDDLRFLVENHPDFLTPWAA